MTRFGLQLPNFSLGVPDDALFDTVVDFAVAGEESGFSSLWVMDHLYQLPALGGEDQPMLEAYTLLGALAARTRSVQLGTLVTGVTYRNPALLAKQITTLDVISGGRAILGIGAAWHDIEHVAFGFDYPPDRERLDRLEEALQICRGMFREDTTTFAGTHYRVENVKNLPRPIRPGGIPIMVGGGGEKRTLRLVAQYADACNVSGDLDTVRHKLEVLRSHCADVGRDPAEVTTTRLGALFLVDTPEQSVE
ncbi:MAG: LLM class F420-dependent oxidoreductase, partial [Acidimicrobiia bacterium]|nr:LLM class F420-dependent oxidoreductase [Acidimicrobiia bacterium]